MAIAPPSDILLDVANAADPVKVREATAKLARLAADPTAGNEEFAKALAVARGAGKAASSSSSARRAALPQTVTATVTAMTPSARVAAKPIDGKGDTYQKFEALLLQSFVESMLPKDDELFGDKVSAGSYRSMMAEQLATQLAKAGGIGIAKAVEHAHPAHRVKHLT